MSVAHAVPLFSIPAHERTFGTLLYQPGKGRQRGTWTITAEPHVMIRVKRVLARVRTNAVGAVTVSDSDEVARDLTNAWAASPATGRAHPPSPTT